MFVGVTPLIRMVSSPAAHHKMRQSFSVGRTVWGWLSSDGLEGSRWEVLKLLEHYGAHGERLSEDEL
jgi:hypothetical protein